ncbi:MAG: hypothetical protein KF734_11970 [Saprospiraceae bacterium]|nr:hypothetical protein [Saprospiraceae bacterium]
MKAILWLVAHCLIGTTKVTCPDLGGLHPACKRLDCACAGVEKGSTQIARAEGEIDLFY